MHKAQKEKKETTQKSRGSGEFQTRIASIRNADDDDVDDCMWHSHCVRVIRFRHSHFSVVFYAFNVELM